MMAVNTIPANTPKNGLLNKVKMFTNIGESVSGLTAPLIIFMPYIKMANPKRMPPISRRCGCTAGQKKEAQETKLTEQSSDMSGEERVYMDTTENVIYLAGGCFWGMEKLMQSIPGVIDAQSGYANGTGEADADYQTVIKGGTGFRETVRVE